MWKRLFSVVALAMLPIVVACRPAPPPVPGEPADVAQAIQASFGDLGPGVVGCMTDVAWRESRWYWAARNTSGASGIFQIILPLHADMFRAAGFDPSLWWWPWANAHAARVLWNTSGIAPWVRC
jgi:hypothetical protein